MSGKVSTTVHAMDARTILLKGHERMWRAQPELGEVSSVKLVACLAGSTFGICTIWESKLS